MATREGVTFEKSTSGFPINRIANTIGAVVTTKMVLRIRDEIAALSQAFQIPGCSGSSV